MPLKPQEFSQLVEMQILTNHLNWFIKKNQFASLEFIKVCNKRLTKLYQSSWVKITESENISKADREAIEKLVPKGEYSIFWQDTIWNTLADINDFFKNLKSNASKNKPKKSPKT